MHTFLGCTYNSQDFAETQENFAQSHDLETVTFRNSEAKALCTINIYMPPINKDRGCLEFMSFEIFITFVFPEWSC